MDGQDIDQRLIGALHTGDVAFADELVADALLAAGGPFDVLDRLARDLRRAGDAEPVARRANHVAEHLIDVTLRGVVAPAPAGAERVLVAGAPGERRFAGLRLAARAMECAGFDVLFAGGPEPFVLARLITEHRPAAVLIGAERPEAVAALHQAIAAVHVAAPDARVLAYGWAVAGRSRVLGATVAEDFDDLIRLLPSRLACAA